MPPNKQLLGTAEAAKQLQVSRDTLLRWFRDGRIKPVQKDGRGWRYFTHADVRRIAGEVGLPAAAGATLTRNARDTNLISESLEQWPAAKPLRLIQYLGSKLRSLSEMLPIIQENTPSSGSCLDLFAGTAVVGQGLLNHCSVYSNDCLNFSKLFGDVLISGPDNQKDLPIPTVDDLILSHAYRTNHEHLSTIYSEALDSESTAIAKKDGYTLGLLGQELPRHWLAKNNLGRYKTIAGFISDLNWTEKRINRFSNPACLITSYYGGNYFGIKQSIEIDSLRLAIEIHRQQGRITEWQAKALLAALLAACSRAVSTAGKHFAQPLVLSETSPREFSQHRTLADRQIDIRTEFREAILRISERAYLPKYRNRSYMVEFEDLMSTHNSAGATAALRSHFGIDGVSTIYADPPYTAQQYSRFYHILETLVLYDYPELQDHPQTPGRVTQGLYRQARHKSVFCSKRAAPEAFSTLFSIAQKTSDCLILSYSQTGADSGNPRMVDPETLKRLGKKLARHTEEHTLAHNYRKLNKALVNTEQSDPEKLYIFKF